MNKKALRADILLLFTAVIWGFGFVAQRSGVEHIGPFTFNGVRFVLGSSMLLPFIFVRRNRVLPPSSVPYAGFRQIIPSILIAGCILFTAVVIQQFGLLFTSAGNAGFITGLYVVITPILGIFLGRKTGKATWIGSALTLTGLYFISVAGRPSVNPGDILIIICAFFWAFHVMTIDRLMNNNLTREVRIDPLELASGQFAVCGILSLSCAFLLEPHIKSIIGSIDASLLSAGLFEWQPLPELISAVSSGLVVFPSQAIIPVLYGGLCSVGIAYTFQVIAQRDAPPAHAVIILCFEGCFAALGGVLLLGERFGSWGLLGFFLMLAGMLATQWEVIKQGA